MTFEKAVTVIFVACSVVMATPTARALWAEWKAAPLEKAGPCDPPEFAAAWRDICDDLRAQQ